MSKLLKNRWIWGCFFSLLALGGFSKNWLAGLGYLGLALFVLPPTHSWISNKLHLTLSSRAKWLTALGLFLLASFIPANAQTSTSSLTTPESPTSQSLSAPLNEPEVSPSSSPSPAPVPTPSPTSTPSALPTTKPSPTPKPSPTSKPKASPSSGSLSNDNYYTNSQGATVHSPAYSDTVPAGATAQCRDGTYSFSQSRRGTCSHHGGVATWL